MTVFEDGRQTRKVVLSNGTVFRAWDNIGTGWFQVECRATDSGRPFYVFNCRHENRTQVGDLEYLLRAVRLWKGDAAEPACDILLALYDDKARPLVDDWLTRHALEVMCDGGR